MPDGQTITLVREDERVVRHPGSYAQVNAGAYVRAVPRAPVESGEAVNLSRQAINRLRSLGYVDAE